MRLDSKRIHLLFWRIFCFFCMVSSVNTNKAPNVKAVSFPPSIIVGDRTLAMCLDSSGSLLTKFFWYKDGLRIKNSTNVSITTHDGFSVIKIESVTAMSRGNYTCTATNTFGSSSNSAVLEVSEPPKWLIEPLNKIALVGDNLTVECTAKGYPKPVIVWKKIDLDTSGTRGRKNNFISQNGTLILNSVNIADSGEYECIADNKILPAIAKKIHVTVYGIVYIV